MRIKKRGLKNLVGAGALVVGGPFLISNASAQFNPDELPMELRGFVDPIGPEVDSVFAYSSKTRQRLAVSGLSDLDTVTAGGDTIRVPNFYRLVIPSDKNSTLEIEGAEKGEALYFKGKDSQDGLLHDLEGVDVFHNPGKIKRVDFSVNPVSAEDEERDSSDFRFFNFPNPFNSGTTIRYEIPRNSNVSLRVYDVLGKEVSTLFEGRHGKGVYDISFSGEGLASGIYFLKMDCDGKSLKQKISLIK